MEITVKAEPVPQPKPPRIFTITLDEETAQALIDFVNYGEMAARRFSEEGMTHVATQTRKVHYGLYCALTRAGLEARPR